MKKIFLSFFALLVFVTAKSQNAEFGVFAGSAFYIGEVNQSKAFFMPSLAYGLIFRHNINERVAFRVDGTHTKLRGSDEKSKNPYQQLRGYSFRTPVTDLSAGIEFNFLPFDRTDKYSKFFSTYLYTGIAYLIIPDSRKSFNLGIPLAFGFKYAVNSKVTFGMEWSIRKTFSDEIDLLKDDYVYASRSVLANKQMSYNPNNDWYSFTCLILTYQIFKAYPSCPAYR